MGIAKMDKDNHSLIYSDDYLAKHSSDNGTVYYSNDSTNEQANKENRTKQEKIAAIQGHFQSILEILELDLKNDSLRDTPKRVANMYVNEIFAGLDDSNKPKLSFFANEYNYDQMLLEKDISLHSTCEHHFLPIIGRAHVAYIPDSKVIGLSKINRIVQYCASRPQVQERLTINILEEMSTTLGTDDVAVWINATHLCLAVRGIKDRNSSTVTAKYSGKFLQKELRNEFLSYTQEQSPIRRGGV